MTNKKITAAKKVAAAAKKAAAKVNESKKDGQAADTPSETPPETPGSERPEKAVVPVSLDELKKSFTDAGNQLRDAGLEPFREMATDYLGRVVGGIRGFLTGIEKGKK